MAYQQRIPNKIKKFRQNICNSRHTNQHIIRNSVCRSGSRRNGNWGMNKLRKGSCYLIVFYSKGTKFDNVVTVIRSRSLNIDTSVNVFA